MELRQYTLRGSRRETLISLFEERLQDPLNAAGAGIIGTFRDVDDPDRFVWIRGFGDMSRRQEALKAFYAGPIWQANREAANATMVDSDNVLLLRPITPTHGFSGQSTPKRLIHGIVGAAIYYLGTVDSVQFTQFFKPKFPPSKARSMR